MYLPHKIAHVKEESSFSCIFFSFTSIIGTDIHKFYRPVGITSLCVYVLIVVR